MHHVDIHVTNLQSAKRFFDALMPLVGYEVRSSYDDFFSYWRGGKRPSLGFLEDASAGSGAMRVAFAVATREHVDKAAAVVRDHGARKVEGPGLHPEYGDDYYAVFFEDSDGNKFEIIADEENA